MLGRAADALRHEREQIGRLAVLVAIGHESRVRLHEDDLLRRAVRRVADGFGGDGVRLGLLGGGRLRFPDELATDPSWQVADELTQRAVAAVGSADGLGSVTLAPAGSEGAILACPLTVKDTPAGVLLTRRSGGFSERDRSLFASLASQLSMGMENARLYHQLDGLFRAYMSPDVATALLADPEQAALGGAVVEVTALFADLRGFTGFSERSTPEGIVVMLNRYFEHATAAILAEGGTVVQFVGRRADGAVQRPGPAGRPPGPRGPGGAGHAGRGRGDRGDVARAGRASASASTPARRSWATSAAPRCAASTRWATP